MADTPFKKWPAEWRTFADPVSGATIRQLTSYKCHNNHLYFTNPGWYDQGHKLMFISDRENRTNLYGVDLQSGEIEQLTDLAGKLGALNGVSISPAQDRACFFYDDQMWLLDLHTGALQPIYTPPSGYRSGSTNFTADGKYVCTFHYKDLSDRFRMDLEHGYVGFRENWEAHPHSMIVRVAVDGSGSEVVFQEHYWVGHVNTSPTLPHILTFCHEGPWNLVENRMWVLDMQSGKHWALRPNAPDEAMGHEYWMADGENIGYHGRTPDGPVYGAIRYDNTNRTEAPFSYNSMHFHSSEMGIIAGDGGRDNPYVLLWRFRDGAFEGPKVLALHRGSFHIQRVHVHPCVHADGKQIVYTADPQGYGQVYLAELPDFDSLPDRDSIK